MTAPSSEELNIPGALLTALRSFPAVRSASHCGQTFSVPALDIYAVCPYCERRVKVRGFTGGPELEDVFDAVFAWMARPETAAVARRRAEEVAADEDE